MERWKICNAFDFIIYARCLALLYIYIIYFQRENSQIVGVKQHQEPREGQHAIQNQKCKHHFPEQNKPAEEEDEGGERPKQRVVVLVLLAFF